MVILLTYFPDKSIVYLHLHRFKARNLKITSKVYNIYPHTYIGLLCQHNQEQCSAIFNVTKHIQTKMLPVAVSTSVFFKSRTVLATKILTVQPHQKHSDDNDSPPMMILNC